MKKIFFIEVLLFSVIVQLYSQDTASIPVKPKTEMQKLNLKVGSILKKQYSPIYTGFFNESTFKFELLKLTDALSGASLIGIYVETRNPNSRFQTVNSSYIDKDEFQNILKFIDYLEITDTSSVKYYTEYTYTFRDFKMGAFSNQSGVVLSENKDELSGSKNDNPKPKANHWIYFIQTDKYLENSQVFLRISDLKKLRSRLKEVIIENGIK